MKGYRDWWITGKFGTETVNAVTGQNKSSLRKIDMKQSVVFLAVLSIVMMTGAAFSEAPDLRTPQPVIYLADNLDEKDGLGWCIDTLGRGFAERLHAHSCKPQGGDVQFSFDAATGLIQSVAYAEYCMAHRPNNESTFALAACDASAMDQRFAYDSDNREIHPAEDETLCVSVGEESRSAGPFMSRTLLLSDCTETNKALREWVILK